MRPTPRSALAIAEPDTEHVVAAREHVHGGGFLGDLHRVEHRQDQDVGADEHAVRVRHQIGEERQRLDHLQRSGQVVMGRPQGAEAAGLGEPGLLDQVADLRPHVEAGAELGGEIEAELHAAFSFTMCDAAASTRWFSSARPTLTRT